MRCQRANNMPSWLTCIIAILVAFLVWPTTSQTDYDYIHMRKEAMYQHQYEAQARNQKKRGSLTTDDHGSASDVFVSQTPKSPLKSRYSCPAGTYLDPQDRYLRETAMHQWVGLYKRMAEHQEARKSGGGIHFGRKNYCRKHCSKSDYGCKTKTFTGYEICSAHLVVPDYSLQIQLVFKAGSRTILDAARCLAHGTDPRVYHDPSSQGVKYCEKAVNSRRDSTLPHRYGAHRQALSVRNPLDKYISGYKEVIKRNKYGMDLWRDNCTDQDNQRVSHRFGRGRGNHYTHSSLPQWMRTGADYSTCSIDEVSSRPTNLLNLPCPL